jgi:hypothetical protein
LEPWPGERRQLIGRVGRRRPTLQVADVWNQHGLYILYAPAGPYYVGITTAQTIGRRIAQHLTDQHAQQWDRFCWFGFRNLAQDPDGVMRSVESSDLSDDAELRADSVIRDMDALLIRAMGVCVRNKSKMNFQRAVEWKQVWHYEVEDLTARVADDG